MGQSLDFYLMVGSTSGLTQQLGFNANSLKVDNNTNQWLYLADPNVFVAPWTLNRVVGLNPSVQVVRVSFTNPPGIDPGIVNPGQVASITATTDNLTDNAGTVINPSTGQRGVVAVDFNPVVLTSAAVVSGATVIPLTDTSGFAPDQAVDIRPGGTHLVLSVQPGTSITLQDGVTANIPKGSAVMRVGVVGIFSQPIAVTFVPSNAGTGRITPAPWQAPLNEPLRFAGTFPTTATGATEVIVGVPGKQIYIFSIDGNCDSGVVGQSLHFVDAPHGSPASGTIIGDIASSVGGSYSKIGPGGCGAALTLGNSLFAWQDNGSTIARGSISYSLA